VDTDSWENLNAATTERSAQVPIDARRAFYRVVGN
jgi:hypothetical protein